MLLNNRKYKKEKKVLFQELNNKEVYRKKYKIKKC